MVTVLTFGSFDHVHEGHKYYLREAKKLGDRLVVVVARDKTIAQVKRKQPKYSEQERIQHVKDLGIVDKIILGYEDDVYKVLDDAKPDVICLGYDQIAFLDKLQDELKKRDLNPKIIRLLPFKPEQFKSSKLKER